MKRIVLKFGGASVKSPKDFGNIARMIKEHCSQNYEVVVVISAMEGMTNQLEYLAHSVSKSPSKREMDMLLSIGERASMTLLAMSLHELGLQAISLTGSQSGIITTIDHGQALIKDVRPYRLEHHLAQKEVVIVAGFQGVSEKKEVTTLGRGGSDTTAVALCAALNAEKVIFYKDVPGVFDKDPKKFIDARPFEQMGFEALLDLTSKGAKILHHRAVVLAQKNQIPMDVISFKEGSGTQVLAPLERPESAQFEMLDFFVKTTHNETNE